MSTLSVMRLSDRRESHTKHKKSATEMKFKAKFTTEKITSLRVDQIHSISMFSRHKVATRKLREEITSLKIET